MTTRKRNEWLEADPSEDEEGGYDSEEEQSKGTALAGRAPKRRRTEDDSDAASASDGDLEGSVGGDEDEEEEEGEEEEKDDDESKDRDDAIDLPTPGQAAQSVNAPTADNPDSPSLRPQTQNSSILKPLTPEQLAASQRAARRTGVIYLSRIPPFMKPSALRRLLSPHGQINRIFLTPEPAAAYSARKRAGGNKKRSFTDGWVEFARKRDAKLVAAALNAQIVGGRKGGWYHDDVWNIRYLKGFKWDDLVGQIAAENREREARMRVEIAQGGREARLFAENVERARMIDGMEARRREKGGRRVGEGGEGGPAVADGAESVGRAGEGKETRRQFRQNEVKVRKVKPEQNEEVKNVLSKIF